MQKNVPKYIPRELEKKLNLYKSFPVLAILGPRQSGKTTLAKNYFKDYEFVNLESGLAREYAINDPAGFLNSFKNAKGVIIDEFQNAPELASEIQVIVDRENKKDNFFVLTGSQNYLMNQAISQSLAGRIGITTLLPLSISELNNANLLETIDYTMFKGGYPRLLIENINPEQFYQSYIQTYTERDLRQLAMIADLNLFQKFMRICAARAGQLINISDISNQCGITQATTKKWLSLLQSAYIIFITQPFYNNFEKSMSKSPKLYFYDTGLLCSLLGIDEAIDLSFSSFRGSIFENFIIADFYKQFYNNCKNPAVYFWRDSKGSFEVDALIEYKTKTFGFEIKSSSKIQKSLWDQLIKWSNVSGVDIAKQCFLVYTGDMLQKRETGVAVPWQDAGNIFKYL